MRARPWHPRRGDAAHRSWKHARCSAWVASSWACFGTVSGVHVKSRSCLESHRGLLWNTREMVGSCHATELCWRFFLIPMHMGFNIIFTWTEIDAQHDSLELSVFRNWSCEVVWSHAEWYCGIREKRSRTNVIGCCSSSEFCLLILFGPPWFQYGLWFELQGALAARHESPRVECASERKSASSREAVRSCARTLLWNTRETAGWCLRMSEFWCSGFQYDKRLKFQAHSHDLRPCLLLNTGHTTHRYGHSGAIWNFICTHSKSKTICPKPCLKLFTMIQKWGERHLKNCAKYNCSSNRNTFTEL